MISNQSRDVTSVYFRHFETPHVRTRSAYSIGILNINITPTQKSAFLSSFIIRYFTFFFLPVFSSSVCLRQRFYRFHLASVIRIDIHFPICLRTREYNLTLGGSLFYLISPFSKVFRLFVCSFFTSSYSDLLSPSRSNSPGAIALIYWNCLEFYLTFYFVIRKNT